MKISKKVLTGFLFCLLELVVGLMVLIYSKGFNKFVVAVAGIGLILFGLLQVIRYYQAEPKVAAQNRYLMKGLLILSCGCFCAFRANWFVAVLPSFAFLLGVCVFIFGLVKIQRAMDMVRMDHKQWYVAFIDAAVSLACAATVLNGPYATKKIFWIFTGILLILVAAADATMLVRSNAPKKPKAAEPAQEEIPMEETPAEEIPTEEFDA